ncbi:hypothetical protein GCM10023350_53260 [Nocardioides endophyticus]|uniref:DUF4064 domain-containing protein n=1 Tax=Nocardioides endophyticus TaxID=1353775 RepID=A0ABP8ZM42_9ACTN
MRKVTGTCISVAALWTALLFVGAVTVPVYSGSSTMGTSDGQWTTTTSATLFQQNGVWVFVLLSVPAVAVLLAAWLLAIEPRHRWARWAAWGPVGLVGVLTVLGILTIGIFLLPVDVLLGIAVLTATLDRTSSQPPPPWPPTTTSER